MPKSSSGVESHDQAIARIIARGVAKLRRQAEQGSDGYLRELWLSRYEDWAAGGTKDQELKNGGGFEGWTQDDFAKFATALKEMK